MSPKPLHLFCRLCMERGLPAPVAEYRFAPPRRWRFDWAWPGEMVALEIEGGLWTRGRHVRGRGFMNDLRKYNAAALAGWRLIRCTPQQFASGAVFELIEQALRPGKGRGGRRTPGETP